MSATIRSAVSKLRCYGRANNCTETVLRLLQQQQQQQQQHQHQRPRYNSSCCLAAPRKSNNDKLPITVLYRHLGTSNGWSRKESDGSDTISGGQQGNDDTTTTTTSNNIKNDATGRKKDDHDKIDDESHLNWKDRKEAPRWMTRMAPTKGGKWPPSPQEAAILVSGFAVFVWSWTA